METFEAQGKLATCPSLRARLGSRVAGTCRQGWEGVPPWALPRNPHAALAARFHR